MPHVADNPEQYLGKHHGETEHCVALVKHAAGLGATPTWRRGERVRGADLPRGTAIATFNEAGRYPSTMSGDSHAAIYLDQTPQGIRVIDQWLLHPAQERILRFRDGAGDHPVNDGSAFYVVETA
jgi:hypothetical protein